MLDEQFSLPNILLGIENVLCIEYTTGDSTEAVVTRSIDTISKTYSNADLSEGLKVAIDKNKLIGDDLSKFLGRLVLALQKVALYTSLKLYGKNLPFNLANVNYCGYAKPQLMTDLSYLLDRSLYSRSSALFTTLPNQLDKLNISLIKRLFIVLLVLRELQVDEGVAVLAQLLYLGGL